MLPETVFKNILTVSELTRMIKQELEFKFSDVLIEGEISNLKKHSSGHVYFTLKDKDSQIKAVLFRGNSWRVKFSIEAGLKVVCGGRINLYEPRGEYSIIVETIEPKGIGSLQLAYEQLKKRLLNEGLFDEQKKKPLPFLPRRIGVVTSPTSAAVRDIISVLHRRFPNLQIMIYPVNVQGEGAAHNIASAIDWFNEKENVDLLIVGRGGGSLEDLWAFNEEELARAIFNSTIPIISAVGHETDYSISDFVADVRAATPSAAAEIAVREQENLLLEVTRRRNLLQYHLGKRLSEHRLTSNAYANRLSSPKTLVEKYFLRIDELSYRLTGSVEKKITSLREVVLYRHNGILQNAIRTDAYKLQLSSLLSSLEQKWNVRFSDHKNLVHNLVIRLSSSNPTSILKKGYSVVRHASTGQVIKNADDVAPGDRIDLTLLNGKIFAIVSGQGMETKQKPLF